MSIVTWFPTTHLKTSREHCLSWLEIKVLGQKKTGWCCVSIYAVKSYKACLIRGGGEDAQHLSTLILILSNLTLKPHTFKMNAKYISLFLNECKTLHVFNIFYAPCEYVIGLGNFIKILQNIVD